MKKIALLCSGAVVAGSLVAGSLVAGAPADAATTSTTTTDSCSGLTTQSLSVTRSLGAPKNTMVLGGAPQDLNLTSVVDVPATLVSTVLGALSSYTGSGASTGTIKAPDGSSQRLGGPASSVVGTLLGDGDLSLPVTPDAPTSFAPSQVGDYQVLAGEVSTTLASPVPLPTLTCAAPADTVLDTIRVLSPSTTTVSLSPTTVAYGQADVATAAVATSLPSTPAGLGDATGSVLFTVGGQSVSATLGADRASARLPRLAAGRTYTVTGAYQPDSTSLYDGSQGDASLVVVKDSTRTTVSAPDIRRKHHEIATVQVRSVHGAVVKGRVGVVLKKGSHVLRSARVALRKGRAVVDLGRLTRRGRTYTVVATYLGNGNFRSSQGKDGFAVK